ncbi:MAG TPA: response regulator [Flavisolibacter sp.]
MDHQKPFIVVVDDDEEDRYLLHCCFNELELSDNVKFFGDPQQFMKYAELLSSLNVRPSLIILDYEMPYMNGKGLVNFLKGHAELNNIPVVILTNLLSDGVREQLRELGVAASYQKGMNFEALVADMKEILTYAAPLEQRM